MTRCSSHRHKSQLFRRTCYRQCFRYPDILTSELSYTRAHRLRCKFARRRILLIIRQYGVTSARLTKPRSERLVSQLREFGTIWTHHYDFPRRWNVLSSHTAVHVYSYKGRGRDIHRRSPRDQSRDRILLRGSLTRRYAEIEESVLYMQNAHRYIHNMAKCWRKMVG